MTDNPSPAFLDILPEVERLARWTFRADKPERRAERVQEAVCQSWAMFARAYHKGKCLPAHGLVWYACQAVRSGRQFCGTFQRDIMYDGIADKRAEDPNQRARREPVADGDASALAPWSRVGILPRVAFALDWRAFLSQRDDIDRTIADMLPKGFSATESAGAAGVSCATVTQRRHKMLEDWTEHQDA